MHFKAPKRSAAATPDLNSRSNNDNGPVIRSRVRPIRYKRPCGSKYYARGHTSAGRLQRRKS